MLAAVWGASFMFMRIASPEFGPISLITVRLLISAIVLFPILLHRKETRLVLTNWRKFLWVGLATTAIPFTLFSYVTLSLTAGNTSLLNATVPMFSAIIAWYWLNEKLTSVGIAGLMLGFLGVFILASPDTGDSQALLLPVMAALCAATLYGYGSCFSRLHMQNFSSMTVTAGTQLFAALFMLPFGVFFWPEAVPSMGSWVSVIALGIFCTALSLAFFFHLLQQIGVANTVSVAYLIPVFGILWGYIFLGESVTSGMLLGGAGIFIGVALTTSSVGKKRVKIVE
ncbi:MAG: EamA family transporter [SAR86 cluster bacterium]|uniref:EamA family transporter n=1 Tax=SAR86 cluster bacterium TaxID=2030880 RepID=A0A2A5CH26_9GAMM|nr:MAG: EamA family transporter [SAR86 cluster bacterium]